MQVEIRKLLSFLYKDKKGKSYLLYGLIFIIFITSLFILNRFFIAEHLESKFFNNYAAAKLVLLGDFDPYSNSFISQLISLSAVNNIEFVQKEPAFGLPLFTLFFYFPFSLIRNYSVAQAIWITFNQALLIYLLFTLINFLEWKIDIRYFSHLAIFSFFFFFIWINVFDQNLSIIQLGFLIASMYFEKKGRSISSGIFLGLCTINPFYFLIPIITFILILIKKKSSAAILWMAITVLLLSLSSLIFQPNWLFAYLKKLLSEPSIFPFISSADNLALLMKSSNSDLLNIIPLGALVWMIVEWFRTPCNKFQYQYWLVSLAFILGQFISIQPDSINSVLLFPVFIYIASLWDVRTKNNLRIFIYLVGIFFSFGLLALNYLMSKDLWQFNYFQLFNVFTSIFLLINLYWVRLWVISSFSLDSDLHG